MNEASFWARVDKRGPDDCWPWLGTKNTKGYGRLVIDGKRVGAHRIVYELLVGPIPEGLELDHLCRSPGCVNPMHLEPVTGKENTLRGVGWAAQNARKTHCPHGHAYEGYNAWFYRGQRICRECRRLRNRAWRKAQRRQELGSLDTSSTPEVRKP